MKRWKTPIGMIVGVTITVEIFMLVTDMGPNLLLVAALGGLVGIAIWFVVELVPRAVLTPPPMPVHSATEALRLDRNATSVQRHLVYSRRNEHITQRLYGNLVELIDDQLETAHQIDRRADPRAAASVLGPELTRFVDDPSSANSLQHLRYAETIVSHIEQL